jgi:tetratricopeptide (TPR) repeat protein
MRIPIKNTGNTQEMPSSRPLKYKVGIFLFRHFIFIGGLSGAIAVHAMTPQEIYRQAEHQVFVLEVLDEKGEVSSIHTAVSLDKNTVVTQCDSVQGAPSIRLRLGTSTYPAKTAQKDSTRNLCLINARGIESAPTANLNVDMPQVGAKVYAVSNALGLGISITEGVVSGIRTSQGESFIQFTAAIAPGSEGGGLFNEAGQLIGLISYRQRDGQNVNFAFPAKWLNEIGQRAASADTAELWRTKAIALVREARWDDLATHATAWSKALSDSAEAWLWLGIAQEQRKNWPDAELAYRQALRYEPSATQAGVALSRVLLAQNKPQPALEMARSMLAYRAEDGHIWLVIGAAERALGHTDEAKQAFEHVVQLEPWNSEAYAGLVSIASLRGDWRSALFAQRQLLQIEGDNQANRLELAGLYLRNAQPEHALASAEFAINLAPQNGDAWLYKGAALYGLKRHHEAIEAMQKAIALKPQHIVWAWSWLANLYYELQLFPEAISAYREALRLTPDDTGLKGRYGIALKDDLQSAEALRVFEKLRDEHPDDPFAWRQIGFVNANLAQTETAISAYEKSLSLDRKQPKVWLALMAAYHAVDRREDLKRAYQSLSGLDTAMAEQGYRMLILPYETTP